MTSVKTAPTMTVGQGDAKGNVLEVASSTAPLGAHHPKQRWRSYVWDTFDKPPAERKFLFKFDAIVLSLAALGYFIKYLDQININNAFVSGMKEDLALYGNQLNIMQTCWTIGYVLGEIPRYANSRSIDRVTD